jgi:hypothetical protein
MVTPPAGGAAWPELIEQLCSALAASHATIECTFDHLEVVVPRDGAPDALPARWLLNGTFRFRASAEG